MTETTVQTFEIATSRVAHWIVAGVGAFLVLVAALAVERVELVCSREATNGAATCVFRDGPFIAPRTIHMTIPFRGEVRVEDVYRHHADVKHVSRIHAGGASFDIGGSAESIASDLRTFAAHGDDRTLAHRDTYYGLGAVLAFLALALFGALLVIPSRLVVSADERAQTITWRKRGLFPLGARSHALARIVATTPQKGEPRFALKDEGAVLVRVGVSNTNAARDAARAINVIAARQHDEASMPAALRKALARS